MKTSDAASENVEVHPLEVRAEMNVVRRGLDANISYTVDTLSKSPVCAGVEKVQCKRLALPRFNIYVRNLALSALLASPEQEQASATRSLVTSDCGVSRLTEAYDSTKSIAPLRNTSRIFS